MRERLVEFIKESLNKHIGKSCLLAENIADDLIANGVVVMPCKVWDIVYLIGLDGTINEYSAVGFCQYPNGVFIDVLYAEKTYSIPIEQVYFLREDAERALKGEKE